MNARAAVALLMLLAVAWVPDAAGGCPDAFIAQLLKAETPQEPPDVESCRTDYTKELAEALVFYRSKKPAEVQTVVGLIKQAHVGAGRATVYGTLAAAVMKALPGYKPLDTAGPYALLDNFAEFQPVKTDTTDTRVVHDTASTVTNTGTATGTPPSTNTTGTAHNGNGKPPAIDTKVALGVAGALLLIAALGVAAVRFFRRKERAQTEERALNNRVNDAANKLDAALKLLDDNLQKTKSAIDEKLDQTKLLTPEHLAVVTANLANLHQSLEQLALKVESIERQPPPIEPPPPPPLPQAAEMVDPVALEHEVLGECWKQFRNNSDASAAFDNAVQDAGKWDVLVTELTKLVPPDLKPMFDTVVAPCKEHRSFLTRIALIPRVIGGEAKLKLGNDADEIRRAREFADLLRVAQSPSDPSNRLNFRFHTWITDTFLPFADVYLQRYQQARLENGHGVLQEGVGLVRRLLRVAAVEPIDVVLGETPFDSTLHVGRSMTNDPRFSDGVITGVVRNGFIEGGQQVIRQPEVIVNRMR